MVNNDPIIWAMVNSIKQLKAENDQLKQRLDALEKAVNEQSQSIQSEWR
jgi:cell division septum initiation protein DivIVA